MGVCFDATPHRIRRGEVLGAVESLPVQQRFATETWRVRKLLILPVPTMTLDGACSGRDAIVGRAGARALHNLVPILTPIPGTGAVETVHQLQRAQIQRHIQFVDMPVDFNGFELLPQCRV
jgi:hypothetical protein